MRKNSKHIGKRLVKKFMNKCFWCRREFGSWILKKGVPVRLIPTLDHVMPYSYSECDEPSNHVAACQICNLLKHNYIFDNEEKTREYILQQWDKKKIEIIP